MNCKEAVIAATKIIHGVHDELKDKDWELELSWLCDESGNRHERVPNDLKEKAENEAKQSLEEAMKS